MENKIRVNSGIVVEVNDSGETIVINADDKTFIESLFGLMDKFDAFADKMAGEEVKKLSDRERLQIDIAETKEIMAEIDAIFGEETCRKAFGNIVPNQYLIADFFDQMIPIAEQYMDVRQKEIAKKYSNKRKGSRSKYRTKEEIIKDAMR